MQTRPIGLIGIDVDGTLVGTGGVIQPRVWEAVARARHAGIRLALCSGRPAFGAALEYAQRLDALGWHIFQNGASVVNLGTGRSRSTPLPTSWVRTLIETARRTGEVLELYSDSEYVAESNDAWAREHGELLGVDFKPRPFESLEQPVVRAQWLLSMARACEVAAAAHPGLEVARSSSPLMRETQFVGMTREGITKGVAMTSIAEEYGVPLADVMYIGDSGNDLSALRVVGHPVAMGNAEAAVREVARHTVSGVDQGGVADALALAGA